MNAKTLSELIRKVIKTRLYGPEFYVFQFPRGHWGCCSPDSPVGRDLRKSGFIYPELNSKARQWGIVDLDKPNRVLMQDKVVKVA